MFLRTVNIKTTSRVLPPIRSVATKIKNSSLIQCITDNTRISRLHLTPEIPLRLITPECRIFHEPILSDSDKVFDNDPFWGFYWPGGQALSRYILDNPALVRRKRVLDVGSGCGASSIAAILTNARSVNANDIDPVASVAARMNADLNGVVIGTSECNMIGGPAVDEDVILLGDLFYDADFAEMLLPWLHELKVRGKTILVGDPGRHGLTENRLKSMKKLATYELTDECCIENNGFKQVHVWQFL